MPDKYIDFDKYRQEKEEEALVIKAFDKELELPSSPRLSIMEKLIQLKNNQGRDAEVPENEIFVMLKNLLGEEELRELIDNGITTDEAEWLLLRIWEQYNAEPEADSSDTKNQTNSTSPKNGEQ